VAKTRTPGSLVTLVPGGKKMFDHELRFEIAPAGEGCTLRLVDDADIPMMMAMMGAEKLLQAQLDTALGRIQELAAAGGLA
jgi:carbon monoxide dehydrogenase subunit G